jgi:hypothetical protein
MYNNTNKYCYLVYIISGGSIDKWKLMYDTSHLKIRFPYIPPPILHFLP